MSIVDLVMRPELVQQAKDYFQNVQMKQHTYQPLLRPDDKPALWVNQETMAKFRPELKKFYYDPTKYNSYLDRLGVAYPPPMPEPRAAFAR